MLSPEPSTHLFAYAGLNQVIESHYGDRRRSGISVEVYVRCDETPPVWIGVDGF